MHPHLLRSPPHTLSLRALVPPQCLHKYSPVNRPITQTTSSASRRLFHDSPRLTADERTHYETLDVAQDASSAEIKKQFYALSRAHHPDTHPNDPTAGNTYSRITEAYHVLSHPASRAKYDATLPSSRPAAASHYPTGSHSSHTARGPAGGRTASGLSKRRGTFRGPPPSFYRHGGYGAYAHREGAAGGASHSHPSQASSGSSADPNSGAHDFDDGGDVLHFNRRRHEKVHAGLHRTTDRSRMRRGAGRGEMREDNGKGEGFDFLIRFVLVSGIVGLATTIATFAIPG